MNQPFLGIPYDLRNHHINSLSSQIVTNRHALVNTGTRSLIGILPAGLRHSTPQGPLPKMGRSAYARPVFLDQLLNVEPHLGGSVGVGNKSGHHWHQSTPGNPRSYRTLAACEGFEDQIPHARDSGYLVGSSCQSPEG